MLFLAVFCGFLAENQREHFVEHQRAKIYAKSFLSDLKADTSEILTGIKAERFRQNAMDSIIMISYGLQDRMVVPGSFYYYSRFVSSLYTIDWNNSTINQLVQSGNLRLFRNKNLIDKINAYYASQGVISRSSQISHERRMHLINVRSKIMQSRYYSLFAGANFMVEQNKARTYGRTDSLRREYPLSNTAALVLEEYINLLIDWRWSLEPILNGRYPQAVNDALEIIEMLKQEFDIE